MLKTVKGHYHNGAIELFENPGLSDSDIIITFLGESKAKNIDLQERGLDAVAAQSLANRLRSFEDDWNDESMDRYDEL